MKALFFCLTYLLAQCGALYAQDLRCVTRYRNSMAGLVAYTDCGSPDEIAPYSDGISWFYNLSRVDKFFKQKTAGGPALPGKTAAAELNPQKANLNALQLETSEFFVYSSSGQQKALIDAYYGAMTGPAHLAAKTSPEGKAELRRNLDQMIPNLAALKELLKAALAYEDLSWGMSPEELKKSGAAVTEISPGRYWHSAGISGVQALSEFRFLDGRLISACLSFPPPGLAQAELEQLRLLISEIHSWPESCANDAEAKLSCVWKTADTDLETSLVKRGGAEEVAITLTSRKLLDELSKSKKAAGSQ